MARPQPPQGHPHPTHGRLALVRGGPRAHATLVAYVLDRIAFGLGNWLGNLVRVGLMAAKPRPGPSPGGKQPVAHRLGDATLDGTLPAWPDEAARGPRTPLDAVRLVLISTHRLGLPAGVARQALAHGHGDLRRPGLLRPRRAQVAHRRPLRPARRPGARQPSTRRVSTPLRRSLVPPARPPPAGQARRRPPETM